MDDLAKQLLLKLALLETAGWLEDSFDKLYLSCAPNEKARSIMEKYITKIHSFNWENLHKGLSFGLGVKRVCELEDFAGEENICKMKSIIGNIKSHRDELAHNYVIQITKQFIPFKTLKKNILFFTKVYENYMSLAYKKTHNISLIYLLFYLKKNLIS